MNILTPPPARGAAVLDGAVFSIWWYGWFSKISTIVTALSQLSNSGYTGTITTAKLTGGGTDGSMTFVNGVLTASTPAT